MSSPVPTGGTAAALHGLSISKDPTGSPQKRTDFTSTMDAQYNRLVQLLYTKLPQELFDKIQETTLQLAICPGYVFPQQSAPGQETFNWNGRTHFIARPELLRLSNGVYAKYHNKYWSENVFVIGKGLASESFEWLDKLPPSSSQSIRKVHLTFSPDDLEEGGEYFMFKISMLHMTELTLEFTKRCEPELAWAAMRCVTPFVHGIPSELRIINYNKQYEEKTLEFLKETHERLKRV
ncbi:MAG: hypothetical protein Q9226_005562 [Calogaya cf. arnoldii]